MKIESSRPLARAIAVALQSLLVLLAAVVTAACGGNGDDGSTTTPPPASTGPTTVTVLRVVTRDQSAVNGPVISTYGISSPAPAFTLPAKATSAEVCVFIEWVEFVSPTTEPKPTITLSTLLIGASPGDWQVGSSRQVEAPGDHALTVDRCGQIDVANPPSELSVAMRVSTSSPAMARHAWLVRWTVTATVP